MQAIRLLLILTAALLLAGTRTTATFADSSTELSLDTFRANNSPAKTLGPLLEDSQPYLVTVTGTFSKWPKSQWVDDGVCQGATEPGPMFPSPGATNGPVGLDAEWGFATPVGSSVCNQPLPDPDGSFRISLDGGASFDNLTADNIGNAPNAAHSYKYSLTGRGQGVAFTINDDKTSDNYGALHIKIEPTIVAGVEFTQGIQGLQPVSALESDLEAGGQPPVPIVAGKPAAMRIYMSEVEETTAYEIEATGTVSESRFVELTPGCTPTQRRPGENSCESLDFFFTPPEGDWSTTLKVRHQQDSDVLEEHTFNMTSVTTNPLVLKPVVVCDHLLNPATGLWNCGSLFDFVNLLPFLRATFPGDVSVAATSSTIYVDTDEIPPGADWWEVVTDHVRALWTADGAFDNLYEYGVVRPEADAGTTGGLAYDLANAAAGRTSLLRDDMDGGLPQETAQELVAHLLGLNMGLERVPSSGGCYGQPAAPDPNWPNGSSPEIGEVGFDVAEQKPVPDTNADWMSLCTPRWISPYTANNVIDEFRVGGPASVETAALTQGNFWLVSGLLDEQAGETEFDPIFQLETEGSDEAGTGPYKIEVRDGSDGVLFTRFFKVDNVRREDEGAEQATAESIVRFAELVPVQAGAAKLVMFSGSDEVGHIDLEGATPVVQLTSGIAGAAAPAGAPPLPVFSWSVQDGDSAQHTFWLELSRDGGSTWTTIAPRYTGNALTIDPALVGGGAGLLLRVLASDGVNTGMAVSEPFNLQTQAPQGKITAPASGSSYSRGDLVWLQAGVVDPEDGSPDDGAIHWSSSLDGDLGVGASLPVYGLSSGTHTISMLARDSDNNELADSITVVVLDLPIVLSVIADIDCSGTVDVADALALLYHIAGLDAGSCKTIGDGEPIAFGDADCDGTIGPGDVVGILAITADVPRECASPAAIWRRD